MAFEGMHSPLSSTNFRGAIKWIIILSGGGLVVQQFIGGPLIAGLGLTPLRVLQHYWLWQVFTYLFLHGGIFHWLFNMLVLWMFGRELEVRWGTPFFLKFFFICGLGSALFVLVVSPNSPIPTIGASGAVFGILTAFAMLFPHAVMYLYFVIPMKAWQAVVLFGLIEFFAGMSGGGAGIGRFAHLGGMVTAYLYLRSGDFFRIRIGGFFRGWKSGFKNPFNRSKTVVFHEVTDDLVVEVDRILEKVLKEGSDSLTPKERDIMNRYSKLKH